ncbi:hypothetical protein [Helicobacter sp. T3_23-1056]
MFDRFLRVVKRFLRVGGVARFLQRSVWQKSVWQKFGKICGNYHCLLGFSVFVWIWLYNGEFWHKINDYTNYANPTHIQAQNATTTNKHLSQTTQNQLKAVPPPLKIL